MAKYFKHMLMAATAAMSMNFIGAAAQSSEDAVLQNIMTRCGIRKFQQKPVEKAKEEKLLRAAMAAPSSRNRQPWHFIVLNTKETIARFADGMRHNETIKGAPLVIIACADTMRMAEGQGRDFWIQDVSAASENLLLAAHAMGLGAVWTSVYPVSGKIAGVTRALHLPGNLIPLNCILVGYPDEPAEIKDKWDPDKVTYGLP